MLFFDFKIILILGLTVTIYFIYREVEYMHARLSSLEYKVSTNDYNKKEVELPIVVPIVQFTEPNKTIIIDFEETKQVFPLSEVPINNITSTPDKFVEVYSNADDDNQQEDPQEDKPAFDYKNEDAKDISSESPINNVIDPVNNKCKYNADELNKMKMSEISSIALENNISLNKTQNGVVKKKLKQDLINDLISK